MDVSYTFLTHLLSFRHIQRQDIVSPPIKHFQFCTGRFLLETGQVSIVGENVYVAPLREHLSYALRKRLTMRHKLVLEVENGDFGDLGAAHTQVPCSKVPNRRRGRRRVRGEWR
jgi:hypothetical protein